MTSPDDPRDVDEARFRALYTAHFDALLAYALRRVDEPSTAGDVAAETFLVAWRRIDQVPPGDEARLWLYGVGRRVLSNETRGSRRRHRLGSKLATAVGRHVEADPADAVVAGAEVRSALATLSADDQELLRLTAWECLEPAEIATVLDLPSATVRTRLSRARERLRRALGHGTGGAGHE